MHNQINPVIKKYDEALKQADPRKNKLLLQLSLENLTFSIFNQELNKFLSIESISFEDYSKSSDVSLQLKNLHKDHFWLSKSFRSIKILFETNKSTLVPSPLFDENEKSNFSKFNFSVEENSIILFNKLENLDAFVLYPVPVTLMKTMQEIFPNVKYHSHAGAFIESLLILNKNLNIQKKFFVNKRIGFLDIVILDGRKLLYFNTFSYKSNEDFIYFVIYVLEQLKLNPDELELVLSGTIDKNSRLFDTIYKYIRNISFQSLSETFNYSYIFNDIPSYYYVNLLNFELCEL